jgi:hypothetical protein
MVVYTVSCCREGKIKKICQCGGTPRERWHAPTLANQLIPAVTGGDKACKDGGRVHHHFEGRGGKSDLLPGSKKLQVTWNLALFFFDL